MAHRWNQIFTSGIVWDPQEPLPAELQDYDHSIIGGRALNLSGAAAHVENNVKLLSGRNIQTGLQVTPTWPIAGPPPPKVKTLPTYTVHEQGRNVLPPLSVTVDASIVQDTARVTVTQLFWNDSGIPIKEAAFTFPLPTGCTVTDFSCRVGTNTVIRGTVKPREEARETFEHHIRHHDTAAGLLEQDTPEIFTTTLGNIPKTTKVKVNLTYITILKHRFADSKNVTTLTIPTSIAPRYGDAPEEYNNAAAANVREGLTLEVEVVEAERITSITSPSHAIVTERRRGARTAESFADLAGESGRSNIETASVKLESGCIFLDKDFVLDITTAADGDAENPQAWLEKHPTMPDHKTLMLTLPPGFLTRSATPMQRSEILFLADRSGSMSDKIESLKSAMQFFLKGIPEGRRFNIWCFGSNFTYWQPRSVDYTEATLNSALAWVDQHFAADMGGTELLPAIKAIVGARDKSLLTDVIVLTDGQTWRLDQTLDYIQKTRVTTEGRVRFFALGIGKAVSHALVDGIAKAGGGYAEVVQEASQGGWEDRVVSMAKAALMSAHVGPLHLEFDIRDKSGTARSSTLADSKRSPADISALNPFDRSRVYFLFDSIKESETITTVKVQVTANHDIKSLVIPVSVLEKRDTTLHKLAARSMLDDLERGRSHIHLGLNRPVPGSWEETNTVRKEAEEIACKWSLVSKWTSFFLAEEPYTPTGDDAFMDGVIEVKDAPGDDLLQPRGAVQEGLNSWASGLGNNLEARAAGSVSPPESSAQSAHRQLIGSMVTQKDRASKRFSVAGNYKSFNASTRASANRVRSRASPAEYSALLCPPPQTASYTRRASPAEYSAPLCPPPQLASYPRLAEAAESCRYAAPMAMPPPMSLGIIATPHGSSYAPMAAAAATTVTTSPMYGRSSEDWDDDSESSSQTSERLWRRTRASSRSRTRTQDYLGPDPYMSIGHSRSVAEKDRSHKDMERMRATQRTARTDLIRDSVWPLREERPVPANTANEENMLGQIRDATAPLEIDTETLNSLLNGSGIPRGSSTLSSDRVLRSPPADGSLRRSIVLDRNGASPKDDRQAPPTPVRSLLDISEDVASQDDRDRQLKATETAFITALLQHQRYDGSVDFGDWATAKQFLGAEIADLLEGLHTGWPDVALRTLWTAAVQILLERDFKSCKTFWELMVIKMEVYCKKSLGDSPSFSDMRKAVRALLENQTLPIHQQQNAQLQHEEKQGEERQDKEQQDEQPQDESSVVFQAPEVVTVETAAPEPRPDKDLKKAKKRRESKRGPPSPKDSKEKEEKREAPEEGSPSSRIPSWMTPWKLNRKAKVAPEPVKVSKRASVVVVVDQFGEEDDGRYHEPAETATVSERSRRRRTFQF